MRLAPPHGGLLATGISMPYPIELTEDCLGIVHAASGVVTGEELLAGSMAVMQLVQNTENFQYGFCDFTDVTELRVEPEHVQRIAAIDHKTAEFRPRAIVVIVAPQDRAYQLAEQWWEKVRDLDWTIHLSRERKEALRWLGQYLKTERPELLAKRNDTAA
ncbi:MAG: hypothetical protein ACXWHF_10180 [Chthoniobacterales bacterium]